MAAHANPTITQNIYIHWQDEEVRAAAAGIVIGKSAQNVRSEKKTGWF